MIWEEFEQTFGDARIQVGSIGIAVAGAWRGRLNRFLGYL